MTDPGSNSDHSITIEGRRSPIVSFAVLGERSYTNPNIYTDSILLTSLKICHSNERISPSRSPVSCKGIVFVIRSKARVVRILDAEQRVDWQHRQGLLS